jgi:hypothetical protein
LYAGADTFANLKGHFAKLQEELKQLLEAQDGYRCWGVGPFGAQELVVVLKLAADAKGMFVICGIQRGEGSTENGQKYICWKCFCITADKYNPFVVVYLPSGVTLR